jgi:hypothetical protein
LVIEAELSLLDRFPYETDADLRRWVRHPGDPEGALPYDGAVPAQIQRLAEERRAERERRAS